MVLSHVGITFNPLSQSSDGCLTSLIMWCHFQMTPNCSWIFLVLQTCFGEHISASYHKQKCTISQFKTDNSVSVILNENFIFGTSVDCYNQGSWVVNVHLVVFVNYLFAWELLFCHLITEVWKIWFSKNSIFPHILVSTCLWKLPRPGQYFLF